MPPPRARQHLRPPLSRRARHTTTTTALPNSGLGSARPFVRWINLRACPASGSSFVMESASRNDRLPRDRTNRMAPSPRSPEAASTAGAFFSNLDRCLAVDPMLAKIRLPGHRQGSGRATSSALTVPANGTKSGIGSTAKTASFKRIRAQRLQGLGTTYIVVNCAACRQRA